MSEPRKPRNAKHPAERPAGPVPDRGRLHEAALTHLSRFAATEAGLIRVLDRRVGRWAQRATAEGLPTDDAVPAARRTVREVVAALVQAGVVDDAAFADARAKRLTRAGRSRRSVQAHLAAKGVAGALAEAVLPDGDTEVATALAYARRRRLGPFRATPDADDPEQRRRELGAMARAGFSQPVAQQALRMDPDAAAAMVIALKQG